MNRPIILLVDDNQTHQYSLGKHLEESGFSVLHATTGTEALAVAECELPDAVLLDINLPDITGFEVCERLGNSAATQSIPVIFHSATHDTQSARARAMDLGAVSFLSYPIGVEHLIAVLRGAFAQRQARERSSE